MPQKIDVGVLGATGMVGQQFIRQLQSLVSVDMAWSQCAKYGEKLCRSCTLAPGWTDS